MAQNASDAVTLNLKPGELDAALDDDTARLEIVDEHGFSVRLGDEQNVRIARVRATDVALVDCRRLTAIDVQHQPCRGPTALCQHVTESEGLQDFQAARLDGQFAGLARTVGLFVDDPRTDTEANQLTGKRESSRSGTHDKDVDIVIGTAEVTRHVAAQIWFL